MGAHTSLVTAISSALYPFVLTAWAVLSKRGVLKTSLPPLSLGTASKALILIMVAALAAKAAYEGGMDTMPRYNKKKAKRILICFFLGFFVFPLPEVFPQIYWLTHSLWHCFMAIGYDALYTELLSQQEELERKRMVAVEERRWRQQQGRKRRRNALVLVHAVLMHDQRQQQQQDLGLKNE